MRWPSSPQKPLLFVVLLGTCLARLVGLAEGYAWCSEYWNWDGKRIAHDGCRWPAGDGVVITYINGIFHSVPEWENITNQLQAIFGHEVRPFYNPSSGWWITDASKAGYHLLRKPANDAIAQALGEHLAQAVEDVGRGRVLHIAHSGGALITYLAAQHHLTRRQRDKIDVLTFGGARSITRKYFSGRVVNYYARNDPLVKLDRRAAELMKLTNNTNFQEISEKHNTTFIFLEGKARQFVLDHSLEGPTYQHALQKEARAFRRAHFGPLSPLSWDYDSSLLRLARKKVAQLSGIHGFFSSEYLGLRSLRKTVARFTSLHGFFSGKMPSTGVAIAVVSSEEDGDPEPQSGGTSGFGRRFWWPWSARKGDDVVVSLPEAETPDTTSRGQFWLGFRWGKQEEAEVEAGGSSIVLDAGKDDDEQDVDVTGSGWSRARGIWGFGRGDSSRPGVVEMEVDVLSETEEDDELISPRPPGLDGVVADESAQEIGRPWLSMAWTPWGPPARKLDVDVVASEAPSNPTAVEESDVVADAGERSAQGSENGDGAASQEDETLLGRWWPRSSLRAAGATNEEDSEGEQGRELDGVGVVTEEGEESADRPQHDGALHSDTEVYVAKEEQQTLLRRWWPVAKEATPAEVLEEDGVGVSKEAGGEAGEFLNSSPEEEAGEGIDVDMEPAPSPGEPGLTSRLWPPIFKAAGTSGDGSGDAAPTVEQQPVSRSQREEIPPSRDDREGCRQLVGEVIVTEESIPLDEEDPSSEEGESEPGDSEEGDGAGKEGETEAEDGVEDSENVDEGGVDVGGQAQEEGERESQEGSLADEGFPSQDDPGHSVSDNVEGVGGSDLSSSNLGVDTALAGGDAAGDGEGVVASTSGAPTTKSEATLEEPDDIRLEANEERNPASDVDSTAAAAASEGARGENAAAASPIRQKQPTVDRQWGWQR